MNAETKRIFSKIADILTEYSRTADQLGNDYTSRKQYYEATYKEPAQYIESDKERIASALNTLIASTRSQLKICRDELQRNVAEWSAEAPADDFIKDMQTYVTFGLQRTEDELNADLKRCNGNLTSMRILRKVAKASGFDLAFDGPEAFAKDLRDLDGISNALDISLPSSCKDFLPAMRQTSTGVWYSLDSVGAIMAQTVLNGYLRDLDSISDKWTADIQPTIKACLQSLESSKNEKSENIDVFSFQQTLESTTLTAENPFESDGFFADADPAKCAEQAKYYFR